MYSIVFFMHYAYSNMKIIYYINILYNFGIIIIWFNRNEGCCLVAVTITYGWKVSKTKSLSLFKYIKTLSVTSHTHVTKPCILCKKTLENNQNGRLYCIIIENGVFSLWLGSFLRQVLNHSKSRKVVTCNQRDFFWTT